MLCDRLHESENKTNPQKYFLDFLYFLFFTFYVPVEYQTVSSLQASKQMSEKVELHSM